MKRGKKKARAMTDVAEEQTGELLCMPVVIEEQTQEPAVSVECDRRAN